MPLQMQESDNTKLEVHGLFRKRLKRQDKERGASVPLWMQENEESKSEVHISVSMGAKQ